MSNRVRWSHKVTTGSTAEPISTQQAKDHCRVDISEDDQLINQNIRAAAKATEEYCNRALITQTHTLILDCFPSDGQAIFLPRPPLQSITSVNYVDTDGVTTAWTDFATDTSSEPGRLYPNYNVSYPTTRDQRNAITIVYVAGYGDDSEDIPDDILSALKLMVCNVYENRSPIAFAQSSELPKNYDWLLTRHRVQLWDIFGD